MDFKDYYKILGVDESASADEIKKSYRKLARKFHPDVSKEQDAEVRFKELGEAYEVLKDPEKRAEYDQLKKAGSFRQDGHFEPPPGWASSSQFAGGGFTNADASGFSDFFDAIFGGRRGGYSGFSGGAQGGHGFESRGQDVHQRLPLFLEEVWQGGERTIVINVPEVTPQGHVQQRPKTLNVKIPKGLTSGKQIRLKGQGGPGFGGGAAGDLLLEVEIAPHPVFDIEGKNIVLRLPVAPWEIALGKEVLIPTLGGKVKLKIPQGSRAGQRLRLQGKGLPGGSPGDPSGDQFVVLQIAVPDEVDSEASQLYEKLGQHYASFNPRRELEENS